MSEYVATFHTHLAALTTHRALTGKGISARMMPVPRTLSSSCGTCVRYESAEPMLSCMDGDVERVYKTAEDGSFRVLLENR